MESDNLNKKLYLCKTTKLIIKKQIKMKKGLVLLAVLVSSLSISCEKKECICKRYDKEGNYVGDRINTVAASRDCKNFSEEISKKNPFKIVCE